MLAKDPVDRLQEGRINPDLKMARKGSSLPQAGRKGKEADQALHEGGTKEKVEVRAEVQEGKQGKPSQLVRTKNCLSPTFRER